jgi:hypothetical protein
VRERANLLLVRGSARTPSSRCAPRSRRARRLVRARARESVLLRRGAAACSALFARVVGGARARGARR